MDKRIIISFAAIYTIWGSTYLAMRYAVETIPPFIMASGRFIVSGGILFALGWYQNRNQPAKLKIEPIHWLSAGVIGSLLFLGGNGGVVWAEQYIPSSLAALIITLVPLWMVLIDWLRPGGRRPGIFTAFGLLVGFSGMVLLIDPQNISWQLDGTFVPSMLLVLASLSWALGSLLCRGLKLPESIHLASAMQMVMGGVALGAVSTVSGEWQVHDFSQVSLHSLLAFAYLTVFGTLAFLAYIYLLKNTSAAKVGTYAYVNPIIAVFLGWALADEPLNPRTLIAATIIISGVVLITTAKGRRYEATIRHTHSLWKWSRKRARVKG